MAIRKKKFPEEYLIIPDISDPEFLLVSRKGDKKSFKISIARLITEIGITSSGGAPIYFQGTNLPSLNNLEQPLEKGDWTLLSSGETYINIGGGDPLEPIEGDWYVGIFNGVSWELKDMGGLPTVLVSNSFGYSTTDAISQAKATELKDRLDEVDETVPNLLEKGGYDGTAKDLDDKISLVKGDIPDVDTASNLFKDIFSLDPIWVMRSKGIEDIRITTNDFTEVWYVSIIRNLSSTSNTRLSISKYGTGGAVSFVITASEVEASTTKIVTKTVALANTTVSATVDFNRVEVDWNNSPYDGLDQMGMTVSKTRFFRPTVLIADIVNDFSGGVNKVSGAEASKKLYDFNSLNDYLFSDLNSQTDSFKSRAKGIEDIRITTNTPSDTYYVAIIRNLSSTSNTRFRIVKYGTGGVVGLGIFASEVEASTTKIIEKNATLPDGTEIYVNIDFNKITDDWSNSTWDAPESLGMTVSKRRYFPPSLTANDIVNDFSGGTTKVASAEETKILKTSLDKIDDRLLSGLRYLWRNNFTSNEWQNIGWTVNENEISTSNTGSTNRLALNKQYIAEERFDRLRFKMSSGSILCVQYTPKETSTPNPLSEIIINASSGLFGMGDKSGTGVFASGGSQAFTFISDRDYVLRITKKGRINTITITDTITATIYKKDVGGGYTGNPNRDCFSCFLISGEITISEFNIYLPKKFIIIRGDSNTEGAQLGSNQRWGDMVLAELPYNRVGTVAGRFGGTIFGLREASNNESLISLPTYEMATIGGNGGNTVENLTAYCQSLLDAGIQPILNAVVCRVGGNETVINSSILTVVSNLNLPCARLDIATALNNDLSLGYNPDLYFADGVHINALGQTAVFNRIKADLPFLFE